MNTPISINTVKEGWKMGEAILSEDGKRILVQKGFSLTPTIIQKLKQELLKNGRTEYFINIMTNDKIKTEQDLEIEELANNQKEYRELILMQDYDIQNYISPDLEAKSIDSFKKAYIASERNLEETIDTVKSCMSSIISQFNSNPNFTYSLGKYKDFNDQDDSRHSLHVAEFAVVLAKIYNQYMDSSKKINLESIATAALLHDYGTKFRNPDKMAELSKIKMNSALVAKYHLDPDLLQQNYSEKNHTIYAYCSLSEVLQPTTASTILLSGADNQSKFYSNQSDTESPYVIAAKIIRICNLYDTLLQVAIQQNISLENVSSLMLQYAIMGKSDIELTKLFIDKIPLYSTGVRVLLSNGLYATVQQSFTGKDNAKPIVKILGASPKYQGVIPDLIDLRYTNAITIEKIIGSSELLSNKIISNSKEKQNEFIESLMEEQIKAMGIASFNIAKKSGRKAM